MRLREKLSGTQMFSDKKLYVSVVVIAVVVFLVGAGATVPQCPFFLHCRRWVMGLLFHDVIDCCMSVM
jgi:hypothetical protein